MSLNEKIVKRFINFMETFSLLYNYEETKFEQLIIQLNLEYMGLKFQGYYEMIGDKANFRIGKHDNPNITITTTVETFFELIKGKIEPGKLLESGKVKVEGEKDIFKNFNKIFGKRYLYPPGEKIESKTKEWKKPGKVLVLNGSARQRKGFTWGYLKYLLQGIESENVEIKVIDIYDANLKINPCYGCFKCQTHTPGKCIINDDATKILEEFSESYLTIFATPLYIYSVPAKFKALLDRTFVELKPFLMPQGEYTVHPLWKEADRHIALFAISGYPELEVFEPLRLMMRGLARDARAPLIAEILRPAAWMLKVLIQYRREYEEVKEALIKAGGQIVKNGKVEEKVLETISRNYIPKDQYYTYNNLFWLKRYKQI